jgi:thioredoxin reductase (NADPH)
MSDHQVSPGHAGPPAGADMHGQMPAETPDSYGAYPRLTADQIARLTALGQQRIVPAREHLFHAGDRDCDFYVVLSGTVAVVEADGMADNRVISVHGPGRFLGELGLLTGEAAYYGAVALAEAAVLAVPVDRLRELVARDPALGDLILRAFLIRRSLLVGLGVGLRVIGSRYSPDARRLRDFAARNRLPAQWLDLEDDADAESLLRQLGIRPEDTPIVILYGQRVLRNPGNAELAAAIGLTAPMRRHDTCELLVVGAGPAGLSAAVYGAADGMQTLVIEGTASGGQAGTSSRIENYLGFPSGIPGDELAVRAMLQAEKFGAQFAIPAEATGAELTDGQCTVRLAGERSVTGRLLVIATGARYRRPDIPRLEHFEATSVYYAASQAEALLCRDDPVVIIGGGNSAGQAAVFLSRHAAEVTVVARDGDLAECMSRYLIDQLDRTASIRVLVKSQVRELIGTGTLEAVAVEDQAGMRQVIQARALFIFIGAAPSTSWLGDIVALDQHGFVRTGDDAMRARSEPPASGTWQPSALETSEPGVFAVGDVRSGSTKRVAAAVGEGAMAIRLAFDRLRLLISRRNCHGGNGIYQVRAVLPGSRPGPR